MLKKNDIIRLEIISVTNEGNGLGKFDSTVVFVPETAAGDIIDCRIVKVNKRYCYGIIEKIVSPSIYRIESNCKLYHKCGGCALRHMSYQRELAEKESFVKDAFQHIGKLNPQFLPIIGSDMTEHYRNKAQFPVSADDDGRVFAGFYARRSHRTVPVTDCKLTPEIFLDITDFIIDFANSHGITAYNEQTAKGMLRHIFLRRGAHSGEIMAALVVSSDRDIDLFKKLALRLMDTFPDIKSVLLNINPEKTNVILGERIIVLGGQEYITDVMCGNTIYISMHSFYQINTPQAERIYAKAAEFAGFTGEETLLDLYCGAGTIGLSMAHKVKKLIGVEIVPQAVDNAKLNAACNHIHNAEFICADAAQAAKLLFERGERPDVIIADPARKGCTPQTLEYMAQMSPSRIIMISCNPATAARDCALLNDLGYVAQKCAAVDFFPRTVHVECVALMSRVKN